MLTQETKRKIDSARQILVGKVPDPKAQIDQITTALIYKFMDDMDKDAMELGGKARFFTNGFEKYAWSKILDPKLGGHERLELYAEAITKLWQNNHLPQLFRDIFKDAFLPYRSPETLSLFLKEINGFTYNHSEDLGDAFEYLLSIMSSQGDAGQFRTPRHIIDFITEVVDPKKDESILDPACGTAGFLISAYKHILKQHDGKDDPERKEKPLTPDDKKKLMNNLVGYDISPDMVKLSKVNMYLHGFAEPKIYEYDTLSSDEKWDEMYDVIMANPPFMSPKGGIRPHKRFSVQANRAEVLFVDYIKEHLRPNGRAGVIVPEGIIFKNDIAYKQLRRLLVEDGLFAVVSLPQGVFNPYAGVKTSIMFFDNSLAKLTQQIIFLKASNDGYDLGAQRRKIKENDLPLAINVLNKYKEGLRNNSDFILSEDEKQISALVSKQEIEDNGQYNLMSDRYVKAIKNQKIKWPLIELAEICEISTGSRPKGGAITDGILSIGGEHINPDGSFNFTNPRYIPERFYEKLTRGILQTDDVLVVKDGATTGKTGYVKANSLPEKAAVNEHVFILRANKEKVVPYYLYQLLKSYKGNEEILKHKVGAAQGGINLSIKNIKLPVPPISVQKEIVVQINGYQQIIEGAKKVIKNWKPSIEIDPDWQVVPLPEVCEIKRGKFSYRPRNAPHLYGGKYPFIQTGDVVKANGSSVSYTQTLNEEGLKVSKLFQPIVVLVTIAANIGDTAILDYPACFPDSVVGLIPNESIDPYFLQLVMSLQKVQLESMAPQMAQKNINIEILKKVNIPVPPINIQLELVEQVQREREIVKANQEIAKEYETKIQQVIKGIYTGKAPTSKQGSQDELIKHLQEEFESIESEVIRMMGNKQIFQGIIDISKKNNQISQGNSFWDLLKESYVALMVSAVCRQVDVDERSLSLINLLKTILHNPSVIRSLNKSWYSKQYHRDNDIFPGFMEGIAEGDFEEHFGSKEYVDPAIVYLDLKKLEEDTKEIKKYRNKRVAHRDKKEQFFKANYNDLHKAVETVRSIASKYYLLLKQGGNDLIPVDQTDWQKIFTIPWIKREYEN